MSYKFKRKETISESVCRISRKCVKKALKHARKTELESIHNVRKEIKKIRALLRLVRHELGEKSFDRITKPLHKAAEILAAPRDTQVQAQALEQLLGSQRGRGSTGRFLATRTELRREGAEAAARFRQKRLDKQVRHLLRKTCAQISKLTFQREGWRAIAPGLKKTYHCAQKARACAVVKPAPENFHAWRKRVKDLFYFAQLLESIWPEQMCGLAADLDALGELLGEDHDFHMLRQTILRKLVHPDVEPETPKLFALIDARQRELRNKTLKLGNRLLQEMPGEFCRRLHRYWKDSKFKRPARKSVARIARRESSGLS